MSPGHEGHGLRLPSHRERLAPDDRLAIPEAGEEYIDGERFEVMAGDAAHADPQCDLAYVVRACVAKGYIASTELLTRTDVGSDFATDICVRREGTDPETGGRYVEEVSFEVANSQTRRDFERVRIPKLLAAGVRRIIVLLVPEGDVIEWSVEDNDWKGWTPDTSIRDRVFKKPLHVKALLDAAASDKLVAEALLAKREPHLMSVLKRRESRGKTRGEAQGVLKGIAIGLAESILMTYDERGIRLDEENRQAIMECEDTDLLRLLLRKAVVAPSAADVLADLEQISEP